MNNNILSYFIQDESDKKLLVQKSVNDNSKPGEYAYMIEDSHGYSMLIENSVFIKEKYGQIIYLYNFKSYTSINTRTNTKKYFTNYKINRIIITNTMEKDYTKNIKMFFNKNIVKKYQINNKFQKISYILYSIYMYGYDICYHVYFLYYKGLKYIRRLFNMKSFYFNYKKNLNLVSLKYCSLFFNIL
jgi:hypothetical protein